jgi:hypothetical protein
MNIKIYESVFNKNFPRFSRNIFISCLSAQLEIMCMKKILIFIAILKLMVLIMQIFPCMEKFYLVATDSHRILIE